MTKKHKVAPFYYFSYYSSLMLSFRRNRDGVSKRFEVIDRLKSIKSQLLHLKKALEEVKD